MAIAKSYVRRLNRACEEKGLSVGALAIRSGYPADVVEPLLRGSPLILSEALNAKLCEILGLDAREMWSECRVADSTDS